MNERVPLEVVQHILYFVFPRPLFPIYKSNQIQLQRTDEWKNVASVCLTCRDWWTIVMDILPLPFVFLVLFPKAGEKSWVSLLGYQLNHKRGIREERLLGKDIVKDCLDRTFNNALRNGHADIMKLLTRDGRASSGVMDTKFHTMKRIQMKSRRYSSPALPLVPAKDPIEKRWRKEKKCKTQIAFNPKVKHALEVVAKHNEESMRRRREKINTLQKKPKICNYRNWRRACKEDPDAIVDLKIIHYRRGGWNSSPVTRKEQEKEREKKKEKRKEREKQRSIREDKQARYLEKGIAAGKKAID